MHPGVFAHTQPEAAACIMAATGEVTTYRQLDQGSNRLARALRSAGLARGNHIAICLENHPRFFEVTWAAQRSGLYYTVISPRLAPAEAAYIARDCGARALLSSYSLRDLATQIAQAAPDLALLAMFDGVAGRFVAYEDLVAGEAVDPLPDESEGADMLYTAGTTGSPRGVRQSLVDGPMGQPIGVYELGRQLFGFSESTVYLSPAPLYHAAPLRFCMAVHRFGGATVVMDRFEPEAALAAIERYKVTHSQWVPTMLIRLLKLSETTRCPYDLSSQVVVIHAAAPCPRETKQAMIDWWGPIIHEYCGGTEGTGLLYCDSQEWLAHPGTVGKPVYGELHVCDAEGRELPLGEPGLLYFGGIPGFEYHNDPAKTAEARHPSGNGWNTLGDIGYVDEDGFVYLVDRRAFTIVSGGVNVYPQEVENLLVVHPKVSDAAVFGVPNGDLGEEVKAVVEAADPAAAGPALERELIDYCRARLAHIKCPRSIDFRTHLPRQPSGKLFKAALRDEYWAGRATRIGN